MSPQQLGQSATVPVRDRAEVGGTEALVLRNHDHDRGYDLRVTVADDAETVLAERYYLRPGATESVLTSLPTAAYRVTVTLDGRKRCRRACHIGSRPSRTAVVEVGNDALSLTEGFAGRAVEG
jgi:hypothetical protein